MINPNKLPPDKNEGWGACHNTSKWHYFDTEGRSLCRRFMLFGQQDLQQGNDDSPDNCKECVRRLEKRKQKRGV